MKLWSNPLIELPNCKISGQDVVSLIAVAHSHVTDLELTRASLNIIQNLIIAGKVHFPTNTGQS